MGSFSEHHPRKTIGSRPQDGLRDMLTPSRLISPPGALAKMAADPPEPCDTLHVPTPLLPLALTPGLLHSPTEPASWDYTTGVPAPGIQTGVPLDGTMVDVYDLFRSLLTKADLKALVADFKRMPHKETRKPGEEIEAVRGWRRVDEAGVIMLPTYKANMEQQRM